MARAVLFGYDGVLVDQSGLREEILVEILEAEGIVVSPESWVSDRPDSPYEAWLERFLESRGAGTDVLLAARLMARASSSYRKRLQEVGPRWVPGARELVEVVARSGVPLALVAQTSNDEVERVLRAVGLESAFKFVVTEADVREPSNRLSGWQLALGLLNSRPPLPERLTHPHEVAAVEAGGPGLTAATEAGLVTIGVGAVDLVSSAADFYAVRVADVDPEWLAAG